MTVYDTNQLSPTQQADIRREAARSMARLERDLKTSVFNLHAYNLITMWEYQKIMVRISKKFALKRKKGGR